MAQYKIRDPDELVQCPFDKVHMIRASRMPYHIMKCKKNFRGEKFEVCPFNACHYVRREDLSQHIATCKDAARIESDIILSQQEDDGSQFHGDCSVPEYSSNLINDPSGEDWDAECDGSRGVFQLGQVTADDYFGGTCEPRRELSQMRLPNSIPKVLQAQNNKLPSQPRGRGIGRGCNAALQQNPSRPGINNAPNSLDERQNTGFGKCTNQASYGGGTIQSPACAMPSLASASANQQAISQPMQLTNKNSATGSYLANQHIHQSAIEKVHKENCSQSTSLPGSQGKWSSTLQDIRPPPGLGRGIAIVSANCISEQHAAPGVSNQNGNTSTVANDRKKEIRKCKKKIREIEALEEKHNQGKTLDSAEQQKVDSKAELLIQLENLHVL